VYSYKQYITHTFILDRGFEFAGDADPFSGDDEDDLSESAPLFEVSCTFLTWEVDGKETLCSLEFLNKSWQEGKANKSTIYMLQNRETPCNTELSNYGYTYKHTTMAFLITMYLYWLFLQKHNFSQAQCKLPEDGPNGPKHVGANVRYFNVNFNILYG